MTQAHDVNGDPVDNPSLAFMEAVCISYFTIEYFLRLAGAPQKWEFIKQVTLDDWMLSCGISSPDP